MKFFHYSAGTVSRSSGRSCVQSVAYATRTELFESRRGIVANYALVKGHDVFWETLSPEGSGIDKNDLTIWDKADLSESEILTRRHRDPAILQRRLASAVPAYQDEFSLPKELTREQNIELVREFVEATFTSKGLVATHAIHFEEGNPHVHITYSSRPYGDGEFANSKTVSRALRGPGGVRGLREVAAYFINKHQEMAGLEDRVDPRSYAQRGIDLVPTKHKGYTAHQLERDGLPSQIAHDNAQISEGNKERIALEPGIIIKELGHTQATFSERDIIRLMQKRLKDDIGILGDHVFQGAMEQVVEVGTGITGEKRYSTQSYVEKERLILEAFDRLGQGKASIQIDAGRVEELVQDLQEKEKGTGFIPNEGQVNGIKTLCGNPQFSVMVGRAGTGKTTTMKCVVQLHQEAGYRVMGMAPSATAASQLEADTGCKSDTIAHYAYYWKEYEKALGLLQEAQTPLERKVAQKLVDKCAACLPDNKTLIIVDEAGMVGVGDSKGAIPGGWDALTKAIGQSGAKLILTGDDHQFKPVEAGDVFRKLVHGLRQDGEGKTLSSPSHLCELTDIARQEVPWMREASHHLAELNVSTALGLYENHGHVEGYASNVDVYGEIARQYLRNIVREPGSRGIVIAATHEERLALNREIRSVLKGNGLLPQEDRLHQGEEGFCVGDKIIFTKNDRGWATKFESPDRGFFVQNSMKAVIQSIIPIRLIDQETGETTDTHEIVASVPDRKATVRFNLEEYKDFTHAYAVTGHKAQGDTLDWVLVKASKVMDAHGLYVSLTRHRQDVCLYYSEEDFPNYQALVGSFSRISVKDLVVDYSVSDGNLEYWQNVQDYKETGRELQAIRRLANSFSQENKEEVEGLWKEYRTIEDDRKSWANVILRDWGEHKDFVRQAGLTKESLEIAAGLKKRSLGRVEVEAQRVVEQYVSVALEGRQLWRDIRRTHPGPRSKAHPDWQKFEDVRHQRGILANQICLRPILYKPFLKETAESLAKADIGYVTKDNKVSYSMATIKAQAQAHQSKILQDQVLKDEARPQDQMMLKALLAYTENRDMAASVWQEIRPKLKDLDGTLLKDAFAKETAEYRDLRLKRDASALLIMEKPDAFTELAEKVGIKLDLDKINEQALQGKRDKLITTYKVAKEDMTRLEAAYTLTSMVQGESTAGKKLTLYSLYDQGLAPKDISGAAREYQKLKLFGSLTTEPDRSLFLLLDEYGDKCRVANDLYAKCANEVKGKEGLKPWDSGHYKDYKAACGKRDDHALEIFDQRDHAQVLTMAEAMGIRFKDVELTEIFSRCEQAERSRHITAYLKAETAESKGEAAVALRQMVQFEKKKWDCVSATARQAYYAGIDFKDLQETAFGYGRACVLKGLSSEKEAQVYHALEAYENALRPANKAYKDCLEESKEKSVNGEAVKPWETDKFKEYICLVTVQDEKAHHLLKGFGYGAVSKVAQEMGIPIKKLDVEAHRHSLRQTLQTYLEGDRTNVPMAARELCNWLEFDQNSAHKHTFKILREQDLWPKDIQDNLYQFIEKKRAWRGEERRHAKAEGLKQTAGVTHNNTDTIRKHEDGPYNHDPKYKTITYERQASFKETEELLKQNIVEVATYVMGNPTGRTPRQLQFGRKGSVKIFVSGPKQGLYSNFEAQVHGGPLTLIQDQLGLASRKDALEWARDWLGGKATFREQKTIETKKETAQPTWTPITPIPKEAGVPDIEGNKYLNYMLRDGNKETGRHAYRDEAGNLKGYVFRIEKADGGKITPPLAYCQNERGFKAWKWQAFGSVNKTPYGLEKLAHDPSKPILVVEGEKTADAAQKLLPGYHVLTWSGGAGNVGKTNWECLAGKQVAIWPDNDEGGVKAAETLEEIVASLNTGKGLQGTVGIVPLPQSLPEKWDLADRLPEGWSLETVQGMIKDALTQKDKSIVGSLGKSSNASGEKTYTAQEQKILTYLMEELNPEKHPWLNKFDMDNYTRVAQNNPTRMLERWHTITGDASFNPSLESLSSNNMVKDAIPQKDKSILGLEMENSQDSGKDATQGRRYTPAEKQILDYLKEEFASGKHTWLDEADLKKFRESAEENPSHTLKRWQGITDDYSFEVKPERFGLTDQQIEAIKTQEREILAYLREEAQSKKYGWLSPSLAQGILEEAQKDPVAALEKWQNLSGDKSFEIPIPDALMTEGQKSVKHSILSYLQENMKDPSGDVSQKTQRQILALAEKHPDKGLAEWQLLTEDYSFNPHKPLTGSREIKVNAHLIQKLEEKGYTLNQKAKREIVGDLHKNPLKAYSAWQSHTNDKTFDAATGIPLIEIQAQKMVDSLKAAVPPDIWEAWKNQIPSNPEAVIKEGQGFIQAQKTQDLFQKDVKKFIKLSEDWKNKNWADPNWRKITPQLEQLAEKYLNDEKFTQAIEKSKSLVAIERLELETQEKNRQISRDRGGRGFDM